MMECKSVTQSIAVFYGNRGTELANIFLKELTSLDKDGDALKSLKDKFPKISEAKIKGAVHEVLTNQEFGQVLKPLELGIAFWLVSF
ncbi:hypothetical protein ABEB36_011364 [Hypothenemus hampei]|uniref:Uncharacterized protein n=1 Tax=Hypothenemus hampei TaxID=57062 RepID=A0ABD1EFE9_HYPHA